MGAGGGEGGYSFCLKCFFLFVIFFNDFNKPTKQNIVSESHLVVFVCLFLEFYKVIVPHLHVN